MRGRPAWPQVLHQALAVQPLSADGEDAAGQGEGPAEGWPTWVWPNKDHAQRWREAGWASVHPWVLLAGVGAGRGTLSRGARHPSAVGLVGPELLCGSGDNIQVTVTKPGKATCGLASVLKSQGKPIEQGPKGKGDPGLRGVCRFSRF